MQIRLNKKFLLCKMQKQPFHVWNRCCFCDYYSILFNDAYFFVIFLCAGVKRGFLYL